MNELIKVLKRYDGLETVIAELEQFDREENMKDLVEYLNDKADYTNMFDKFNIGKIVYIVMEKLDWSKVDRKGKKPRKYLTVVEGKVIQHASDNGTDYCVCLETKEPNCPFDFTEDDCGKTVFLHWKDANEKMKIMTV